MIRTTHTGSLPRVPSIEGALLERESTGVRAAGFDESADAAVREVVDRQLALGLDIINDGEQHKPSYATYVVDRLDGFGGDRRATFPKRRDSSDFPGWARANAPKGLAKLRVPTCNAPLVWRDFAAVEADIARLSGALSGRNAGQAFMTAASPGVIAMMLANEHYETHEAYLRALGAVMKREYEAIVAAGYTLQIDCPDLGAGYNSEFSALGLTEFLDIVALHVDVLNEATASIDPAKMRMHVCWGNYNGPHNHDVPLVELLPHVLAARPAGLSFEAANPRHNHEWIIWRDVELPDGKYVIPGVIDTTTNYVEHPELVTQRIKRYTRTLGADRVVAGCDCGFGTMVGMSLVHPEVAWAKLAALVEGARRA